MCEAILHVLRSKDPYVWPETATSIDRYAGAPPEMVLVEITVETVNNMRQRISGGSVPGVTEAVSLYHWLLWYGDSSAEIRKIGVDTTNWLANSLPPWDAYSGLMSGRLISINKQPEFCLVGTIYMWRHCMEKFILLVAELEAKDDCGR